MTSFWWFSEFGNKVRRFFFSFEVEKFIDKNSSIFTKSLEKEDWMKQFVSEDKKTATFILYKRKLRSNFKLGFTILLGDDMFLGEEYPLDKATDLWKDYL